MNKFHLCAITTFSALSLTASAVPVLSWDARDTSLSDGALNAWQPTINTSTSATMRWVERGGDPVSTRVSGTSNFDNIGSWISSPDYQLNDVNGAATNGRSWANHLGNAVTQADASWEMVFRPGDYTGKHTLFNTGGNGDGLAIVLIGDTLEFRFQDAPAAASQIFLSHLLTGPADEFIHLVGVADMQSGTNAAGQLYVNGALVASGASAGLNDWDGGDTAELGWGNNIPGSGSFGPDDFTGDIALFNYYNTALTASQVTEAYADVVPDTGSTLALLGCVTAGFALLRRKLS